MTKGHLLQKFLFAGASTCAALALVGILVANSLMPRLSFNSAWILAMSLPVLILGSLAGFGLFLLVRLFQGEGLSRRWIVIATLFWVAYAGFAAFHVVRTRRNHDSSQDRDRAQLASLVTNPPAFFDRLDQLAARDDSFRQQAETLIGFQAFRRPDPGFVSNYFARATALVPPGPWIPRSLLFGIQELNPGDDTARLTNLARVLLLVEAHQPGLLRTPFSQRGQTNTLRGFILDDARTAGTPGSQGPVLELLPPAPVP